VGDRRPLCFDVLLLGVDGDLDRWPCYTERWETREYDLSKLRGVDLFLSTWGSPLIAHTIASWAFK